MNYSRKTSISGASAGIPIDPSQTFGFVGTWTLTREASGNYDMALTAAANSPFLVFPLVRGVRLLSIDFAYSIATAPLTTLTAAVKRRVMHSGSAPTVTDLLAATALPTALAANPIVANLQVGATIAPGAPLMPVEVGAHENDPNASSDYLPDTHEWVELAIVNPGTSVFKFYGAWLYGDKQV